MFKKCLNKSFSGKFLSLIEFETVDLKKNHINSGHLLLQNSTITFYRMKEMSFWFKVFYVSHRVVKRPLILNLQLYKDWEKPFTAVKSSFSGKFKS